VPLAAERIVTISQRLVLEPLSVDDAEEMVAVLDDEALFEFTGGGPPGLNELRDRYRYLAAGPEEPGETWLNWVVRVAGDGVALGTVQATISCGPSARPVAELSWVIGTRWQRQGIATEATRAVAGWLDSHGVEDLCAHIHASHYASAAVARHLGLAPTGTGNEGGEVLWRSA
jgi:RimJ/RimL family protein N-acetyltransferase